MKVRDYSVKFDGQDRNAGGRMKCLDGRRRCFGGQYIFTMGSVDVPMGGDITAVGVLKVSMSSLFSRWASKYFK